MECNVFYYLNVGGTELINHMQERMRCLLMATFAAILLTENTSSLKMQMAENPMKT